MRLLPSIEHRRVTSAIHRFVYDKNDHYIHRINGSLMVLPAMFPPWYYTQREPQTVSYVNHYLKHGDICVDVGANLGLYTLLFARKAARVYAFEPNSAIRKVCKRAVALNDYQNVILDGQAISDEGGLARFYVNRTHELSSLRPRTHTAGIIDVEKVRIDDLGLERVDWLKIDVEGHEVAVLRGAQRLIARNPQIRLIVEFIPEHGGFDEEEFFRLLEGFEFKALDYNMICWKSGVEE